MTSKKSFGVWMDSHDAVIVGKKDLDSGNFIIIGHIKGLGTDSNSNENALNNQEITLRQKFFKDILSKMPNVDEMHVTGTGRIQEQFINYLAEMPQYKNVKSSESTSNKMSDEKLISFVAEHYK